MKKLLGLVGSGFTALPRTVSGRSRRTAGTLLASLVAFVAALLVVYLVFAGWLYPLRPDVIEHLPHPFTRTPDLDSAWGGPTLVGAWLVHALVALAMQLLALALIRRLTRRRQGVGQP
jgi:ABC-type antimicrobial peptide transport system permease subunit